MRNAIIVGPDVWNLQAFTSLKKACAAHGWNYRALQAKTLPTYYKGHYITRLQLQ